MASYDYVSAIRRLGGCECSSTGDFTSDFQPGKICTPTTYFKFEGGKENATQQN